MNGGAFQYGYPTPSSKLRPPPGWSVLWGDPAITGSRAYQQYVYISNVAVNNASFPASGFIEGSVTFGSGGKQSFISGACIARSSDYGQTFSLAASDCVKNVTAVPTGDFYDGGSMESDLEGRIYASWVNWSTGSIDVWWAQTPTSSFTRIITPTGPLAGFTAESHARLRYDPIADRIYLMALVDPIAPVFGDSSRNTGHLMIDYFDPNSGTWHGAVNVANDCLDQPDIIRGTILGLPAKLRTAVSFSFDVGRASPSGGDDIRIVYAGETSALPAAHLKSVVCSRGLACMGGTMNTLGSPGEQFNPLVVAQYGFLSIPSQWKVSWSSTEFDPGLSGSTLSTMETDFGNFPIIATFNQPLCPDQRGYWGDYDDMQILSAAAGANTFIRARTESADRCQYRTLSAAKPLHVTALEFQ